MTQTSWPSSVSTTFGPCIDEFAEASRPSKVCRGLHQVIVDREERVMDLARIGIGQQRVGHGTIDAELDDLNHD